MKNCDYCGREINRNIFCSNSHKVMFHTAGKNKDMRENEVTLVKEPVLAKSTKKIFNTEMCDKHSGFKGTCGCS